MDWLRALVNAWLATVAADGVFRLVDGLLDAAFGLPFGRLLVFPAELMAYLGAVAVLLATAADRRVPVRVVLPPLITLAWLLLGALPFSVLLYGSPALELAVGAILLLAVLAAEGLARSCGHGRWGLRLEAMGEGPGFSWRRLVGWGLGWALLAPPAAGTYLAVGLAWTLWYATAGFLVATPTGLSVAHKRYTLDRDTVHLVAMIHLGESSAYDQLFAEIPTEGTRVLAEGIHDERGLLTAPRDAYQQAASAVGLTVQAPAEELFRGMEVQNADVDVSDFDPVSVELLNAALGLYAARSDPVGALTDYLAFWDRHRHDSRQVVDQLFEDILVARNAHLLEELERARAERDRILIPWGALHMVGIERALRARGWTLEQTDRVVLIRWATLLDRGG